MASVFVDAAQKQALRRLVHEYPDSSVLEKYGRGDGESNYEAGMYSGLKRRMLLNKKSS